LIEKRLTQIFARYAIPSCAIVALEKVNASNAKRLFATLTALDAIFAALDHARRRPASLISIYANHANRLSAMSTLITIRNTIKLTHIKLNAIQCCARLPKESGQMGSLSYLGIWEICAYLRN
jgi:hypothetical protein